MAKRVRDYKAEERRRNELARQRGYTSRAAERGVKERAARAATGFTGPSDVRRAREAAQSWSDIHSKVPVSEYSPRFNLQQLRDYMRAFGVESEALNRKKALAKFLHSNYPENYPQVDDDEYWRNY